MADRAMEVDFGRFETLRVSDACSRTEQFHLQFRWQLYRGPKHRLGCRKSPRFSLWQCQTFPVPSNMAIQCKCYACRMYCRCSWSDQNRTVSLRHSLLTEYCCHEYHDAQNDFCAILLPLWLFLSKCTQYALRIFAGLQIANVLQSQ